MQLPLNGLRGSRSSRFAARNANAAAMVAFTQQVAAQTQQLTASPDPVEQAMGRYMERMTNHWNEQTNLTHEGAQVIVFRAEGTGDNRMQVAAVAGAARHQG